MSWNNKGVKMTKNKVKKVNMSLFLEPADALRVLEWAYENGMITYGMYAGKIHRIIPDFEI